MEIKFLHIEYLALKMNNYCLVDIFISNNNLKFFSLMNSFTTGLKNVQDERSKEAKYVATLVCQNEPEQILAYHFLSDSLHTIEF